MVGASFTRSVVEVALDAFVRTEQIYCGFAIYRKTPSALTEGDVALVADSTVIADDTYWSAIYRDETS